MEFCLKKSLLLVLPKWQHKELCGSLHGYNYKWWKLHKIAIYIIKENKETNSKRSKHPNVIAAVFTIAKTGKQPKCPLTEEWIKEDVAHIYIAILFSYEKEWDYAICRNMDRPRDYHTKWNKRERQIYITYMWNLKKNDTSELMYKTEID